MNNEALSIPAWTYKNEEFFQLEQKVIMTGWQLVGHTSDIPDVGSYLTCKIGKESIVVIRNENNEINAFYNVCRHRASRLLDGDAGKCERRIKCPYHAWTYDYSGNLLGAPNIKEYPDLDKATSGLYPVESEVYLGFVFIRLESSGKSIAELMAPVHDEFASYNTETFTQEYEPIEITLPVNWKIAVENFLDGIHVPFAHPGLNDLIGARYSAEVKGDVYRAVGPVNFDADLNEDVKKFAKLLEAMTDIPEEKRNIWLYYFISPNTAFCIYPDKLETMQFVANSHDSYTAIIKGYATPNPSAEVAEARKLSDKINIQTQHEDDTLLLRVQEGLSSAPFSQALLGQQEVLLRGYTKEFKEKLPVSTLTQAPETGQIEKINTEMLK